MVKKGLGLYLTDTVIYLCTKEKIYTEPVDKNLVINNRIALTDEFYRFMNKVIKKYKINDSLLGKNITIIELPNYLPSDKELINSVLEKLSFNNINYIEYFKLIDSDFTFNLNEKNAYVTISKQNYFIEYHNFQENIIDYLLEFLKKLKEKEIFLIGNFKDIKTIASHIEKKCLLKVYTYQDSEFYIINRLKKLMF